MLDSLFTLSNLTSTQPYEVGVIALIFQSRVQRVEVILLCHMANKAEIRESLLSHSTSPTTFIKLAVPHFIPGYGSNDHEWCHSPSHCHVSCFTWVALRASYLVFRLPVLCSRTTLHVDTGVYFESANMIRLLNSHSPSSPNPLPA